jgi:hypothetical protein
MGSVMRMREEGLDYYSATDLKVGREGSLSWGMKSAKDLLVFLLIFNKITI